MRLFVYSVFLSCLVATTTLQAQFVRTSLDLPAGNSSWGDYDGDGDLDLAIAAPSVGVKIYQNHGNGTLSDVHIQVNTPHSFPSIEPGASVFWFDANIDGELDLLVNASQTYIYTFNTNGNLDQAANLSALITAHIDVSFNAGDYDNDGDLDLLASGGDDDDKETILLENHQNFAFSKITLIENEATLINANIQWLDYDNDGYLDILMAALQKGAEPDSPYQTPQARILRNDGQGSFHDTIRFLAGEPRHLDAGDFDGDGNIDVMISGKNINGVVTRIYRNEGDGKFKNTFITSSKIVFAWGDYDNDGDLDVLGQETVLRNDGENVFTEISHSNEFTQPQLVDYNGDGRLDVCDRDAATNNYIYRSITEKVNIGTPTVPTNLTTSLQGNQVTFAWGKSTDQETSQSALSYNLYVGLAPFTEDVLSPESISDPTSLFYGVRKVIRQGNAGYKNHFTLVNLPEPTSAQTYYWSVQAIDQNGKASFFAQPQSFDFKPLPIAPTGLQAETDHIGRIKITWVAATNQADPSYIVYRSLSVDNGYEIIDTIPNTTHNDFPSVSPSTQYIDDNTSLANHTTYYYKVQAFNKRGHSELSLPVVATSNIKVFSWAKKMNIDASLNGKALTWGDYDNDGDLDLLVMGEGSKQGENVVQNLLYNNHNGQSFSLASNINNLPILAEGSAAWGDYNGDGFLDLVFTGDFGTTLTRVFRNDEGKSFKNSQIDVLQNKAESTALWGDYDNDGDLDLIISGEEQGIVSINFYRNEQGVSFVDEGDKGVVGINKGDLEWGDYDNDGDLDLLIGGFKAGADSSSVNVYINDGSGGFSLHEFFTWGAGNGSVRWGDYNNDGFLDILIAGAIAPLLGTSGVKIFKNIPLGDGRTFEEIATSFMAVQGVARWLDYDNDGDLDVLVNGVKIAVSFSDGDCKLYRNNGNDSFVEDTDFGIFEKFYRDDLGKEITPYDGRVSPGDYNNDGSIDFALAGVFQGTASSFGNLYGAYVYKNEAIVQNTAPTTPTQLQATVADNTVTLTWNKSTDAQTPQAALTYNLRIGTSAQKEDICPSMANPTTGLRKIAQRGFQGNQKILHGLGPGIYHWSVQALDHSLVGSAFAQELTFRVVTPPAIPNNLTATPLSSSSIVLTWTSLSDADNFSGYIIEASPSNNAHFSPVDTITSDNYQYEVEGLNENTAYFFRIRAVNTAGNGISDEVFATTTNLPRSPIQLKAVAASATQIRLSWQDVAISEQGFIVERKSIRTNHLYVFQDSLMGAELTEYIDNKGVVGNVAYTYRVFAYNANGRSTSPNEASATTPSDSSTIPPAKPTIVASPISPALISLSWQYDSEKAHYFSIERSSEEDSLNYQQIAILNAEADDYEDNTVDDSTVYYYRMRAVGSGGYSDFSNIAFARAECNLPIFISLADDQTQQICNGQGSKLIVTTSINEPEYQWTNYGVEIPHANLPFYLAQETGIYACQISAQGCVQTTNQVIILKQSINQVEITLEQDTIRASTPQADRYFWYYNYEKVQQTQENYFIPKEPGRYHLVTENNDCTNSSNVIYFSVNGLNNQDISAQMQVIYNHANQTHQLVMDTPIQGDYQLWLRNAQGQRVYTKKGTKQYSTLKESIDFSTQPSGIYLLEIVIGKHYGVKKIVCIK
ncbi:FG-GAP-like repeat-containing protein [Microscilla marina]|uniref:FG-GAP repeat domain protein n=1 Tax=Microscilla marina ATCC 23134 TaxID=313606 RepID=A1ZUK8_MICM2|nr:FG-GAP-like repeat-containing protein [Microscilla marina]EAY25894.1 FG-GAP repeat domain protein [Microscilla marina ATCC 23134]